MGTETLLKIVTIRYSVFKEIKLNNPLMGTETVSSLSLAIVCSFTN